MKKLYLAGPEVFLVDAVEIGALKRACCQRLGFDSIYPLDGELSGPSSLSPSRRIFAANIEAIAGCDAIIANLTPFRGVSADPGTVFEIAHGLATGKKVFAYTADAAPLRMRIEQEFGEGLRSDAHGRPLAGDSLVVEDFGLADNLMVAEAILSQGWNIVLPKQELSIALALHDMSLFEACLMQAKAVFDASASGGLAA